MKIKRILSAMLALCLTATLLPSGVQAAGNNSGTFTAASMNVDGLPQKIMGITINGDGPGADGTRAISAKLSEMNWDIIGVSEDFNYNTELMTSLGSNYNSGTHRGGVSWLTNDTDGLNLIWKNTISVTGESWTAWNTHYGNLTNGNDGMIDKGYRYYQAEIDEGVKVDVYILHMDADSDQGDIDARHSQLTQLANAIKASDNGNPIIVMGDTNCRYTRENLKTLFIDEINKDSRFTIQDPWIDLAWDGVYPEVGAESIMAVDKGGRYEYPQAEIVDKLFYINNTDSDVTLTANSYKVVTEFTDADGNALADHWPILVEFSYTVAGEEPHVHSYTLSESKDATCTEPGSRVYICSCGDSYTETIPSQGHKYENGVCTVCGAADPDAGSGEEDTTAILGNIAAEISSGRKYAVVFPSLSTSYSLGYNENGTIASGVFQLEEGDRIPEGLIWTLTETEKGYTISAEVSGVTKYLARTKSVTNGGYKITMQDTPFVWTVKARDSDSFRISAKVVSKDYALRYYTQKTGWIVSNKQANVRLYEINE